MDEFDRDMVPNTSDDERRYSYEKQPDVGAYNLDKLRQALEPLLSYQQRKQVHKLIFSWLVRHYVPMIILVLMSQTVTTAREGNIFRGVCQSFCSQEGGGGVGVRGVNSHCY